MYGFVNQAVRDFVVQHHGDATWQKIRTAAGVTQTHFVSDEVYDDRITYSMVGAISEELGVPMPDALKAFGEYWISYVSTQGFAAMLSANGTSFVDFLRNLDQLHARLAAAYPKFVPPEFLFQDHKNGAVSLTYVSRRKGLWPMVEGIIQGLAKMYDTEIQCEACPNENGAEFLISVVNESVTVA